MANESLNRAKNFVDDEFYTRLSDIEKELRHYKKHFKGKTVLCNCDDPFESAFFKFFVLNFNSLQLKKLICTCYSDSHVAFEQLSLLDMPYAVEAKKRTPYKAIVTSVHDADGDGSVNMHDIKQLFITGENKLTKLKGNGDFASDECIKLLDGADIVVTNPPFSKFSSYLNLLIEHEKKFIIIGSLPKITNLDLFPLIQQGKMWLGYNEPAPKIFYVPDTVATKRNVSIDENGKRIATFGNVVWFTNLDLKKRHEELTATKHYTPDKYPKYDNYDAIECQTVKDIPCDYTGVIGVTPGFLERHNPEQFDIVGVVSAPKNKGSLNIGKDYHDYIGYNQKGQKNGRTGSTFGRNAVLLGDDGKHDYYEKNGVRVHSASARIFIRYTQKWINDHPEDFNK